MAKNKLFKKNDFVVYPNHGMGCVEGTTKLDSINVLFYLIAFEQVGMRLMVPVDKAKGRGLRRLSSDTRLQEAIYTLTQSPEKLPLRHWQRAEIYEAKILSGQLVAVAEVVRDLYHASVENQLGGHSIREAYEKAIGFLAHELALIKDIDKADARKNIEKVLAQPKDAITGHQHKATRKVRAPILPIAASRAMATL